MGRHSEEVTVTEMMASVEYEIFTPGESASGRVCRGPLEVFSAVVQNIAMNAILKFDAIQALDQLRDYLDVRQERGLEYVFARALSIACLTPTAGGNGVYAWLVEKFRSFDRRQQQVSVVSAPLPITIREPQLRRFTLTNHNRADLVRAFHIARAIDVDGPWGWTRDQEDLLHIMMKVLTGFQPMMAMRDTKAWRAAS